MVVSKQIFESSISSFLKTRQGFAMALKTKKKTTKKSSITDERTIVMSNIWFFISLCQDKG